MQQIPGVNLSDLQKLDERISGSTSKGNRVEKVKKDLFKKLTGNVCKPVLHLIPHNIKFPLNS